MKIAILKERREHERRVSATPDTVRKMVALGLDLTVEIGAGDSAGYADASYEEAGAAISPNLATTVHDADIVLAVQRPLEASEGADELALMKSGTMLVGLLAPLGHADQVAAYALQFVGMDPHEFGDLPECEDRILF